MTIRQAAIEDLDRVLAIVANATREMESRGIHQWDDVYPSADILRADIDRREMYVLERAGEIAGIIVLNEDQPEEYTGVSWSRPAPAIVVHRLTIDPAHQHRGLATNLMRFADMLAGAKGFQSIRLDAFTQNPVAVSLYERLGYRKVGTVSFRKGPFFCFEKKAGIPSEKPLAVFDLDGTLYKTECVSLRAVHSAIQDFGLPDTDDDTIRSLFGYTTPDLCAQLFPDLSPEALSALSDRVRHYERALIRTHGELYSGIREMLGSVRSDGWSLALCTNGSEPYVNTVLSGLELWEFFDAARWKTGSSTKSSNLQSLAAGREALTVKIGDKGFDVEAAKDSRIPSIGVTWGYGAHEEISAATFVVEALDDLKSVFHKCRLYHDLLVRLRAKLPIGSRPSIVGINGVDTAGKTCFAKEFASFLRAQGYEVLCVHLDDFHNKSAKRREGPNPIDAYISNAFDLDTLESRVLAPFRANGMLDTELTLLDLMTDEYSARRTFVAGEGTVLLLEGTLLFREPIDRHLDYRIYLDVPFDEVLRRARVRDVPLHGEAILEGYRNKYVPIQQRYLKEQTPDVRSDALIDNTDFEFPRLKRIS